MKRFPLFTLIILTLFLLTSCAAIVNDLFNLGVIEGNTGGYSWELNVSAPGLYDLTITDVDVGADPLDFSSFSTDMKKMIRHIDFATNTKVEKIASYAFKDFTGLRIVSLPSSLTAVGKGAFSGCSLDTLNYADCNISCWESGWNEGLASDHFERPSSIGCVYYSDNTWSGEPAPGAIAIGIVFAETSDCIPSKLVALTDLDVGGWTSEDYGFYDELFDTSDTDGSGNWEVICNKDPNAQYSGAEIYPAFFLCNNYRYDGFSWYLPAVGELQEIYKHKEKINESLANQAGAVLLDETIYWSSSQDPVDGSSAQSVMFDSGTISSDRKNSGLSVRAVLKL